MEEPATILSAVLHRRSVGRLSEPGPTLEQLEAIIRAGASAPDHGRLKPWRFVVFQGEARLKFGELLAELLKVRVESQGLTATESQLEKEKKKLLRAPVVVAVCAALDHEHSIPVIEQFAATAAACENMLIAATALGIGSMWRTGDPSYDNSVKTALNLKESDMVAGWLYFGSAEAKAAPNGQTNNHSQYVTYWH